MLSFEQFLDEEIKGWKNAHADLAKARRDASGSSGNIVIHKLKADGKESGMSDARKSFDDEESAHKHIANMRKLNPGRPFKYNMYVDGKHVGEV